MPMESISASIARTTFRTSIPVSGEVLFPSRQSRLSVFRYCVRSHRRVHLLRPSLPRRCARAWTERRGDRFQSVGNCGRTFRISLATRTTGARGCEWLFHRRDQSHRPRAWDIGEFYGQSYFCDPRGQFVAEAPRDKDALVVADLDLDKIREVRNTWQFFRDRRPDTYGALVADSKFNCRLAHK